MKSLTEIIYDLDNLLDNELPDKLSKIILEHFLINFDNEGFNGQKWKKRKKSKKGEENKPVLGGRTRTMGRNLIIKSATMNDITIAVNDEIENWAWVHQYGTDIMPQRQFMGDDSILEQLIEDEIIKEIDRLWD